MRPHRVSPGPDLPVVLSLEPEQQVQPDNRAETMSIATSCQSELKKRDKRCNSRAYDILCRHNPISLAGKRIQMAKMMFLTLLPILALLLYAAFEVRRNLQNSEVKEEIRDIIKLSQQVGMCVHYLQRERGYTAMYASKDYNHATFILMRESFRNTDKVLESLANWPGDISTSITDFPSKADFEAALSLHRQKLIDSGSATLRSEMDFYNELIDSVIGWMYQSIQFPPAKEDWRHIVAYQLYMSSKNYMGMERTLGSIYYLYGYFQNDEDYLWYIRKHAKAETNFDAAMLFYPDVKNMTEEKLASDHDWDSTVVEDMREEIRGNDKRNGSLADSMHWFNNMTVLLDAMFDVQEQLAQDILLNINTALDAEAESTVQSIALLTATLIVSLVIILSVRSMVSDIQRYAYTLSDQTRALHEERRKAESLLYQMLPPDVASQLKHNQNVPAQTYDDATVFFSDIVGFTVISASCSPMDVVTLLNTLYSCFDSRLEHYDVYKVETIGDAYMVSSGVPRSNGRRHVMEIATMALDIAHHVKHIEIPHLPGRDLQLRAGINTGPVVAGVVGSKMPRYCLFGDTVNMASRMESTGEADKIQISQNTYYALCSMSTEYTAEPRGLIDIKGKGRMETYWLLDKNGIVNSLPCMPGCRKFEEQMQHRHNRDQQIIVE